MKGIDDLVPRDGDTIKKEDLLGVELVVHSFREEKGKFGSYPIVLAARKDSGERFEFFGTPLMLQRLSLINPDDFPFRATVETGPSKNGKDWWDLTSRGLPPEDGEAPQEAVQKPPSSRTAVIQGAMEKAGLSVEDVRSLIAQIGGEGARLLDLDDGQYFQLLAKIQGEGGAL